MNIQYVYHFKRKNMWGDKLIPLNSLKSMNPSLYEEHVKKYKGREKLLLKEISLLNCLWNDVIHLSPINPQIILNFFKDHDLVSENRLNASIEVYKIPVKKLKEERTICFQSFNFSPKNFDPSKNKFWKFEHQNYQELNDVSDEQKKVWKSDHQNGRELLWYSHTMHILTKDSIEISDCEIFSIS